MLATTPGCCKKRVASILRTVAWHVGIPRVDITVISFFCWNLFMNYLSKTKDLTLENQHCWWGKTIHTLTRVFLSVYLPSTIGDCRGFLVRANRTLLSLQAHGVPSCINIFTLTQKKKKTNTVAILVGKNLLHGCNEGSCFYAIVKLLLFFVIR